MGVATQKTATETQEPADSAQAFSGVVERCGPGGFDGNWCVFDVSVYASANDLRPTEPVQHRQTGRISSGCAHRHRSEARLHCARWKQGCSHFDDLHAPGMHRGAVRHGFSVPMPWFAV